VVLGEGRAEGWSEDVRRLNRDGIAVVERERTPIAFERLEQFAEAHRLPGHARRPAVPGILV